MGEEHLSSQMGVWSVIVGQEGDVHRGALWCRETQFLRALLFVLQMGMEEKLIRNGAKADKVYSLPWLGLYMASMPVLPAAAAPVL